MPAKLTHRVRVRVEAAPPGKQEFTEVGGETAVDREAVAVIGPPLRGARYVAADSCCDASRHTRAALPVNGRVWIAQRYAVDWEQLDDEGRIYHGPQGDVKSYTIYRKEVLAVADATVASTIEGHAERNAGEDAGEYCDRSRRTGIRWFSIWAAGDMRCMRIWTREACACIRATR